MCIHLIIILTVKKCIFHHLNTHSINWIILSFKIYYTNINSASTKLQINWRKRKYSSFRRRVNPRFFSVSIIPRYRSSPHNKTQIISVPPMAAQWSKYRQLSTRLPGKRREETVYVSIASTFHYYMRESERIAFHFRADIAANNDLCHVQNLFKTGKSRVI